MTPTGDAAACSLETGGRVCGSPVGVRRYLPGLRCAEHAPANPTPDPDRTLDGLRARTLPETYPAYGTATDDPLGRTRPGTARTGFIPRRPDPK